MDELEKTVEPDWPKLVEPLEKILDKLVVVWGIVSHLKAVKDSPELRSAIEEVQVNPVYFCFLVMKLWGFNLLFYVPSYRGLTAALIYTARKGEVRTKVRAKQTDLRSI